MHIAVLLKHIACTQSQVEVSKRKSIFMIAMNSSQVVLQSQLGVGKGLAETPRAQTNLINKLDGILQQWASLLNGWGSRLGSIKHLAQTIWVHLARNLGADVDQVVQCNTYASSDDFCFEHNVMHTNSVNDMEIMPQINTDTPS